MLDTALRLPLPPLDAAVPEPVTSVAMAVFGGLAACAALYALRHWITARDPVPLLIVAGGALTSVLEPFVDILGACWHPTLGQDTAFDLMGRRIPWWVVLCYTVYFGGFSMLTYRSLLRGSGARKVWLWFLLPVLGDLVLEEVAMCCGLYAYYGPQPLILLWKFPFWWAATNSLGELLGASLLVLLRPALHGYRLLLVPLLLPLADAVGYAASAMPAWLVINTPLPYWVTQLGGVATFGLAALCVQGLAAALAAAPRRSGEAALAVAAAV